MSIAEKLTTIAENEHKVYDAGKQAEYEQFWDNVSGIDRYGFAGVAWNVHTFRPNKRLACVSNRPQYAFSGHNAEHPAYDLAEQLAKYGGSLDFSRAENDAYMFYNANVSRLPAINLSNCTTDNNNLFTGCKKLVTIDEVNFSPKAAFTSTFSECTSLENITIAGGIGTSINFQACPLSVASMKSVIEHLVNYKGTASEGTYTLYFSEDSWATLNATSLDVSVDGELPNLSWREYVQYTLGWNT